MAVNISLPPSDAHRLATRKAMLRLIPLLVLIYLLSYLDRTNVSIAQLQLKTDIGLTPAAYGFGAGIFFLSYALLEVPSNLAAYRYGPRRWICRIALTWGVLSAAMMFVQGPWSFYLMRVLLGAAEAGLFPAMMYMITLWFAQEDRATAVGWVYLAPALALLVGSPLGGGLMGLDGLAGLKGWQWLFLLEGVPTVLVGIALWFWLPERPRDAGWLKPEEAQLLEARAGVAEPHERVGGLPGLKRLLLQPIILLVGGIYFFNQIAFIGLIFFTPSIIQQMHVSSPLMVGVLSSAVGVGSVAGVLGAPWLLRRVKDAPTLIALLTVGLAAGLVAFLLVDNLYVRTALLACMAFCGKGVLPLYWAVAMARLKGLGAAGGLAFINCLGLVGAFLGPYLYGVAESLTASAVSGFGIAVVCSFAGLALVPMLRRRVALPTMLQAAHEEAGVVKSP